MNYHKAFTVKFTSSGYLIEQYDGELHHFPDIPSLLAHLEKYLASIEMEKK